MAVFQREGNLPVESNRMITRVILGAITGATIRKRRALILSIPLLILSSFVRINLHDGLNDLRNSYNWNREINFRIIFP
jgi:hypothetical protein